MMKLNAVIILLPISLKTPTVLYVTLASQVGNAVAPRFMENQMIFLNLSSGLTR